MAAKSAESVYMDKSELTEALNKGFPVTCGGITYTRVSAIICRNQKGKHVLSAELSDKNGNSVTIARPDLIEKFSGDKNEL